MKNSFNVALASFGMSSTVFHAPFIQVHEGFNLYAVWERTVKKAYEQYPNIISYKTYEEILNDSNVDIVIVNTPNFTHYALAKQALEANKHVIVEKPFTVTNEEAEELIQIAGVKKLLLSVYHNRRWDADFLTVKHVIDNKQVGEVVEAALYFDRYSESLSYKIHKETPGPGTGSLYDLGSHLIDQALQLFGMPLSVFAHIDIIRPISKVDDYFEVILFYPHLRVKLHSTYLAAYSGTGYIIHGTKASFIKPKTNVQEIALLQKTIPTQEVWVKEQAADFGSLYTVNNGNVLKEVIPTINGNYMDYYNNIYNALLGKEALLVTPQQAAAVIKIIEAAYKSKELRQIVDL